MAQNYSSKTLGLIDERFSTESKTADIVNKGIRIDFNGVNSVTIYNVDTVAENDYVRSGYNRFGTLVELGTGQQTFVLSQDKSFTFSVDRGNYEDSMMAQEVNKAVKRQVREVSIPTTDIYRLGVAFAYARTKSQGTTGALTASNIFAAIQVQQAALIDALVPIEDMVLFMNSTTAYALFNDTTFKLASNGAYADNKNGLPSSVLGMELRVLPTAYLPTNMNFMIIAKNVLISPVKFDMVRILSEVQGIDGWVAEGRRYYDAFIATNKGPAIRYHATS